MQESSEAGTGSHRGFRSLSSLWLPLSCALLLAAKPRPVVVPVVEKPSRPFPEEAVRALWDRGCDDWPVAIDPARVETNKIGGDLRVQSRLVLLPERGESVAELYESTQRYLKDEKNYQKFVMPGINEKPQGGRYFVTVDSFRPDFDAELGHRLLTGTFNFKILWFQRAGTTSILFRSDEAPLPDCPAFASAGNKKLAPRFLYRMIPREDLLERFIGEFWVYPVPGAVEIRLRIVSRPSKIVYELLPEQLVRGELEVRGRRIFENFVDFRRLDALARVSSAARKGSSPAAAQPVQGP